MKYLHKPLCLLVYLVNYYNIFIIIQAIIHLFIANILAVDSYIYNKKCNRIQIVLI